MCFYFQLFPCQSPEQKYKNIEKKIFQLLEESILVSTGPKPDVIAGLAKAKEASSMDRTLLRMRNQSGSNNFTHNFDLTYSVSLQYCFFLLLDMKLLFQCDSGVHGNSILCKNFIFGKDASFVII